MNDNFSNILFWVNFVGVAIFIVNSIHATVVLQLSKTKDFKPPDLLLTTISVGMAIMFMAISLNMKQNNPEQKQPPVLPKVELHKQVGLRMEYDSTTKTYDTIKIFEEIK